MVEIPEILKKHPIGQFIVMLIFCIILVSVPIRWFYENRLKIRDDRIDKLNEEIALLQKRNITKDNIYEGSFDAFLDFYYLQKASVLSVNGRQELGAGGSVSTQTERLLRQGIYYLQKKDYANALLKFDGITEIQPYFAYANYFTGIAYRELGQKQRARESFQEAISDFDLLLKVRPKDPYIFLFKGGCYTFLKNGEKSVEMLNLAKEIERDLVSLHPKLIFFVVNFDGLTAEQANVWANLIKEMKQAKETK